MVVGHVTPMHPVFLILLASSLSVLESSVRFVPRFGAGTPGSIVRVCYPVCEAILVHLAISVFGCSSMVDGAGDCSVHCATNRVAVVHLLFNGVQSLLHHVPEVPCR